MREDGRWEKILCISCPSGWGLWLPQQDCRHHSSSCQGAWHSLVCVLIPVFLAGHAEIIKTVSYEEKNSSQLNFPYPANPPLNFSNLCAKHHSLMNICRYKFSEVNRKPFENCNPNPFFFSIMCLLIIMTFLSSIFIYGELK